MRDSHGQFAFPANADSQANCGANHVSHTISPRANFQRGVSQYALRKFQRGFCPPTHGTSCAPFTPQRKGEPAQDSLTAAAAERDLRPQLEQLAAQFHPCHHIHHNFDFLQVPLLTPSGSSSCAGCTRTHDPALSANLCRTAFDPLPISHPLPPDKFQAH